MIMQTKSLINIMNTIQTQFRDRVPKFDITNLENIENAKKSSSLIFHKVLSSSSF